MSLEVSDCRVILPGGEEVGNERLLAYVEITLNHAIRIRDIKLIRGDNRNFLAFPDRSRSKACTACGGNCRTSAAFCEHCGSKLDPANGPQQYRFSAIVLPISPAARQLIEEAAIRQYTIRRGKRTSTQP